MKVYIVNKEDTYHNYTLPLKGYKKEEEAVKYMNLCAEEILRDNLGMKLVSVNDQNRSLYYEEDDEDKDFRYIFYISTVEVF